MSRTKTLQAPTAFEGDLEPASGTFAIEMSADDMPSQDAIVERAIAEHPPSRGAATRRSNPPRKRRRGGTKKPGYEVVCVSLYKEDLQHLDRLVARARKNGHRKVSRSSIVRFALAHADVSKLPRSY